MVSSWPPTDERWQADEEDPLASLVEQLAETDHRAALGMALRFFLGEHGHPSAQHVARPHRLEPAQLVETARTDARRIAKESAHEKAHEDRTGVPAARDQAFEHRARRRLL